jgi:hypothetical protein
MDTVDATLAALYGVISGPAGQPRDWDRMRALFIPNARIMVILPDPDGGYGVRNMDVEGYISVSGPLLERDGFFETEIARQTDTFGQLSQVFSTYEGRYRQEDKEPRIRGINSIQLYHDGRRWWILGLVWRAEDATLKLPEQYLKNR